MGNQTLAAVFFLLFGSGGAYAATGSVMISSPTDGAMVSAKDKIMLDYDAVPGPDGDHLHLNVDGKRIDVIRPLKGTAEVAPLAPGKHQICLVVNTKGHVPTDAQKCINVTAK